jgi:uncharacterized lipoprotein
MRWLVVLGAVVAALAGCGGDEEPAQTPTPTATPRETPSASVPRAPDPPPDVASPGPEEQQGGAGDEEPARVPVLLTLRPQGVRPAIVHVPPFLNVELRVRNRTRHAVSVTVREAAGENAVTVAEGESSTLRLEGLKPGRYTVDAGIAGEATIVAGDEAGP